METPESASSSSISSHPVHHLAAAIEPHPKTAEIIHQVEYYFSDENLPTDGHLLDFTGFTGDGWVSINRIFGFKKMKQFKPQSLAQTALKESTLLEVDKKLKHVRRAFPLPQQLHLEASRTLSSRAAQSTVANILIARPWLSKNMLKPTGFEDGFTEGPLKPDEYEHERRIFDPEEAFTIRIDYAVARFLSKRKMHQDNLNIFSKYLLFGDFSANTHQFTGAFGKIDLEEYSTDEILRMKSQFGVSDRVFDGLCTEEEGGDATWVVDFEGMTKAFFSSHFLQKFSWKEPDVSEAATKVIRNFFNYLLYHEVCPEYTQDIIKARDICNLAEQELPKLAAAACGLPGDFNTACSTIFEGHEAMRRPSNPNAEWVVPGDDLGWSDGDAKIIWHTSLAAHCTEDQHKQVEQADEDGSLTGVGEHETGLEVIEVQLPSEQAKGLYESEGIKDTFVRPTGKLVCKRWAVPGPGGLDLPEDAIADREAMRSKKYEFLVEEEVLRSCYPGLKMRAIVAKVSVGDISYLDRVLFVYPSFFLWTLNEQVKAVEGAPKEWMKRQNDKHKLGDVGSGEVVEMEAAEMEAAEMEAAEMEADDEEMTPD